MSIEQSNFFQAVIYAFRLDSDVYSPLLLNRLGLNVYNIFLLFGVNYKRKMLKEFAPKSLFSWNCFDVGLSSAETAETAWLVASMARQHSSERHLIKWHSAEWHFEDWLSADWHLTEWYSQEWHS